MTDTRSMQRKDLEAAVHELEKQLALALELNKQLLALATKLKEQANEVRHSDGATGISDQ